MKIANKVIYNTGFQFIKMLISLFISLYTTRLVLNALGIVDYGIFNLIAGVISFLSFLNAAISSSSQRFIAVYLGEGDLKKLKTIFKTSIRVHLIVALVVVSALEIAGIFLFDGFLNIPQNRVNSAYFVFHLMVVSTFFTINAVPYDALINAHENLLFDSILGILESLIKLGFAIWLTYSSADLLILYGIFTATRTIVLRIIKSTFCLIKYPESRKLSRIKLNKNQIGEQFSFTGWNLFGSIAAIARNQGFAIILNLFFGAAINAAFAIANQVTGQLKQFSIHMIKAINPQIMKSEGAHNRGRLLRLSMIASKFSFFIMAFFSIPFMFEMEIILKLWLKEVPEYAVVFCNLVIVAVLTNQLTIGLASAFQASGKIKRYQSIVGTLIILNLPLAYILLKSGLPPYSVLISSVIIELVACFARIYLLHQQIGFDINEYTKRVLLKSYLPILFSLAASICITFAFDYQFRFLFTIILTSIIFLISIYFFGLTEDEKYILKSFIVRVFKSLKKI